MPYCEVLKSECNFKIVFTGDVDIREYTETGSTDGIMISSTCEPGNADACAFCPFARETIDKDTEEGVPYGTYTLMVFKDDIAVRAIHRGKIIQAQ